MRRLHALDGFHVRAGAQVEDLERAAVFAGEEQAIALEVDAEVVEVAFVPGEIGTAEQAQGLCRESVGGRTPP